MGTKDHRVTLDLPSVNCNDTLYRTPRLSLLRNRCNPTCDFSKLFSTPTATATSYVHSPATGSGTRTRAQAVTGAKYRRIHLEVRAHLSRGAFHAGIARQNPAISVIVIHTYPKIHAHLITEDDESVTIHGQRLEITVDQLFVFPFAVTTQLLQPPVQPSIPPICVISGQQLLHNTLHTATLDPTLYQPLAVPLVPATTIRLPESSTAVGQRQGVHRCVCKTQETLYCSHDEHLIHFLP